MSQSDFVSRGQALVAAGQFQEAVKVCRLGLLGRPTTVEGRVVLGQALLALKRFDEVLAEMRVALELDHTSIAAQVLRAEALLRKGDTAPAIEALHKARQAAPGDMRIMQLLGEAESQSVRPSVTHPAVGFVGSGDTKHYPGHTKGSGRPADDDAAGTEHFTKPTSLSSPGSARRSGSRKAQPDPGSEPTELTPPPDLLAVGDRSGTMEVDPESEGVELARGDDFDDLAAPPPGKRGAAIGGERGSVRSSRQNPQASKGPAAKAAGKAAAASKPAAVKSSRPQATMPLDIDDDDAEEMHDETGAAGQRAHRPSRPPGPGTAVRQAVAMPSGPLDISDSMPPPPPPDRPRGKTAPPPRPGSSTQPPPPFGGRSGPSQPPPFGAPQSLPLGGPAPLPPAPRSPIVAALPTVAAAQPPPPFVQQQAPYPPTPASLVAAARPTIAVAAQQPPPMSPAQQASAAAVDQLFGGADQPAWAQATIAPNMDARSVAASHEPTARPGQLDPQILALMSGQPQQPMQPQAAPELPPHLMAMDHVAMPPPPVGMRTGVRKARSRVQIAVWILIGIIVIGGGVFAGFQIRAMRLDKQIAAARQRATDQAKGDTFGGWIAARDSLASIASASATASNRAALARTRALIAYEFGDGLPEAKTAVEQLAGQGGLDGNIARAFDALVKGDAKAARTAGDAAVEGSEADATAQYLAGRAALLGGNTKLAVAAMKLAADKEARPLHGIGLAHAYAAAYNWDEAIAALDRVLAGNADHPAAAIARATMLSASGRIFPGSALGKEVRDQLERVIVEGRKAPAEQKLGVSPTQLAFAYLALARVELARGDVAAGRRAVRGATDVNIDDARFAEETVVTLYQLGELQLARIAAERALAQYAANPRVHIAHAQVLVALGKANEAVDVLTKNTEAIALADGLVVRGNAYLATGDLVNAATDFDAALKAVPTHEPALVGRAWLELVTGDVDSASKRMAERMGQKGASIAVKVAYAATLRRSADPAQREQAKTILEQVAAGPATPDALRAHLELARVYRDSGDFTAARVAYDKAAKTGSLEARLELALLLIDYSKPTQGREVLEKLLEEAGDRPSPQLVIEAARARMLVGAHDDASKLLAIADKMSSVERWKLDRERGRLAFRKADYAGAAVALGRALDTCGDDVETFLLAADTATAEKSALADKIKQLVPERLKGKPEAKIVDGKLLIAAEQTSEAEVAYKQAKTALKAEKASNRRLAQADFGLAFIAFLGQNNAVAQAALDVVLQEDPTIVDAYMMGATIAKEKKKAFEYASKAVELNPDYAYAWAVAGRLAHELKDKKMLTVAIGRLQVIAPAGDELKELQKLRGN